VYLLLLSSLESPPLSSLQFLKWISYFVLIRLVTEVGFKINILRIRFVLLLSE
jgi:hypothetical protein